MLFERVKESQKCQAVINKDINKIINLKAGGLELWL
jgi:hypothetical protein